MLPIHGIRMTSKHLARSVEGLPGTAAGGVPLMFGKRKNESTFLKPEKDAATAEYLSKTCPNIQNFSQKPQKYL